MTRSGQRRQRGRNLFEVALAISQGHRATRVARILARHRDAVRALAPSQRRVPQPVAGQPNFSGPRQRALEA